MCVAPGSIIKTGNIKPSDIVPRAAIVRDGARVYIDLKKLSIGFTKAPIPHWPPIEATKSMLPTFGSGHNNLLLEPADADNHQIMVDYLEKETQKGYQNIIVWRSSETLHIIHRVVKVGEDEGGRYFRTKGDNIFVTQDPHKVRDEEILYISVGIIF